MKSFMLSIALFTTLYATAQQGVARVPATLPAGSVALDERQEDTPDNRFLNVFYHSITYPLKARQYGVTGAVLVQYMVDTKGELTVTDTRFLSQEELTANPRRMRKEDIVHVVGYAAGGSAMPRPTRNEKKRELGKATLIEEVKRTLSGFPRFVPATIDGEPVPDHRFLLVTYDLE